MKEADEERIAARLAKLMAIICVRNTGIEDLHAGTVPVTHTGDFSDVFVTDADGRRMAWTDVSHMDDEAMRNLMRQIVDRLYTFHMSRNDPQFRDHLDRWLAISGAWDDPKLDEALLAVIRGSEEPDRPV
jgi:chorismate mutase